MGVMISKDLNNKIWGRALFLKYQVRMIIIFTYLSPVFDTDRFIFLRLSENNNQFHQLFFH
uniref:Uncharacterized protein n=1 Tax=Halalkalibacterium halodurans TaxID=86665 RepID=A0A0M0KHF1_ALKHA